MFTDILSLIPVGLVLLTLFLQLPKGSKRRLPPGPKPWPVIGNIFDMPREKEWLKFMEWRKTYGDIVSLSVLGRTFIVLNSIKAASDLLDKRSVFYSDRPRLPMATDMIGYDHVITFTSYGERFNSMRRLIHKVMGTRAAPTFSSIIEQETARFLGRLLKTPEDFSEHIRHMAGAIILKISHGYTVSTKGDPLVGLAEQTMKEFSIAIAPGAFLVDLLPWLKHMPMWLPGTGFKRKAAEWRKNLFNMANSAHEFTMNEIKLGRALPSFTSNNMEGPQTQEHEELVKWTALSMYGGGSDTTVSASRTFFLAMCTHPHVQVIAQAEIDSVLGGQRLPTMADRPFLPYVEAIYKEVLRWGPIVPGAVPHQLNREDEYNGYMIPEGAIILPNILGMLNDPEFFPNPSEFRPERFLGSENVTGLLGDHTQIVFGFGRRACPGRILAEASLFLEIAMTLATFTISKARDGRGAIIEPKLEWNLRTISHPKSFCCEIRPRSSNAVDLVNQQLDSI